jgi:hypothetical protein
MQPVSKIQPPRGGIELKFPKDMAPRGNYPTPSLMARLMRRIRRR